MYANPQHPYTQALLASVPELVLEDDAKPRFVPIAGELPSPLVPPPGCHFHQRCPKAVSRCTTESPLLRELTGPGPGRSAACHLLPGG